MEIHVTEQAAVFLWTALSGIISGLVYELFRICRKIFNSSDRAVLICDMLFWIISAAITFGVIFNVNSGQLRWYLFAGFAIGGIIYFFLLAGIVSKILIFIIKIIFRISMFVNRVIRVLCKPFVKFFKLAEGRIGKKRRLLKKTLKAYRLELTGKLRLLKKIRKTP